MAAANTSVGVAFVFAYKWISDAVQAHLTREIRLANKKYLRTCHGATFPPSYGPKKDYYFPMESQLCPECPPPMAEPPMAVHPILCANLS